MRHAEGSRCVPVDPAQRPTLTRLRWFPWLCDKCHILRRSEQHLLINSQFCRLGSTDVSALGITRLKAECQLGWALGRKSFVSSFRLLAKLTFCGQRTTGLSPCRLSAEAALSVLVWDLSTFELAKGHPKSASKAHFHTVSPSDLSFCPQPAEALCCQGVHVIQLAPPT